MSDRISNNSHPISVKRPVLITTVRPPTALKKSSHIDVAANMQPKLFWDPEQSRELGRNPKAYAKFDRFERFRRQSLLRNLVVFEGSVVGRSPGNYLAAYVLVLAAQQPTFEQLPIRGILFVHFCSTPRGCCIQHRQQRPTPPLPHFHMNPFFARLASPRSAISSSPEPFDRFIPIAAKYLGIEIRYRYRLAQTQTHREFKGFSLPRICGGT